jgi:hypothetical protein
LEHRVEEVHMRVDQTGNDEPPAEIVTSGPLGGLASDLGRGPDGGDPTLVDQEGLRVAVSREHPAIDPEVGRSHGRGPRPAAT